MKKLKSEKGVITVITLVTVIVMVSFLISSYVIIANKVKTQKEMLAQTKAIYEPKYTMEEIYNSYFSNNEVIPIYTTEQLLKIGSNEKIDIDGKIYSFSNTENTTYALKNNLELDLEQNWVPVYRDTNFLGKFDCNGHTLKLTTLNGDEINYNGYLETIKTSAIQADLFNNEDNNLVDYKIYGNSIQNGTPSATNQVEIRSVGDKINLFDINSVTTFYDYDGREVSSDIATISDGVISSYASPQAATGSIYCNSNIKVLSPGTYTISADIFNNQTEGENVGRIGILYDDGTNDSAFHTLHSYQTWERKSLVFTIEEETEIKGFYFQFNSSNEANGDMKFKNIQLEKGSRRTEYSLYGKYRIEVNVSTKGKNLFNIGNVTNYAGEALNQNLEIQGNKISAKVRSGAMSYFTNQKNKYSSGTYSISAVFSNTPRHLIFTYDENGNILTNNDISISGFTYNTYYKGWWKDGEQITVTVPDTVSYWYYGSVFLGDAGNTETIENIQIEKGTKVTEYEPNIEQTYNIYLDEPLRKAGDYADYIDFKNMEIVRQIETAKIEDWEWVQGTSLGTLYRYETLDHTYKLYTNSYSKNLLSTHMQVVTYATTTDYSIAERHNFNRLCILVSDLTTVDEMLDKLGDASIYYVLATPDKEPIELPTIELYEGTNVLTVDTDVAPSSIFVSHILETP